MDKPTLTRDEQASIIGQVTTNWDFSTALNLAEANLTVAQAADKGTVYILAPNDGTARAIADAFAADKDVTQYFITGQDAEKASVQYIIDGKQSMTVFKDVRTLAADAVAAANAFVAGTTPEATNSYNNGNIDVPAKPSAIVTVTSDNVVSALIDSGYYQASDFTGLGESVAPAAPAAMTSEVGVILPTKDEPRWLQDQAVFQAAGFEPLFSQSDSAKEMANVETLISQGIKVLIITPQDATAAAAAADAAHAAGIKVISYDRLIRDTASVDYYVTFDSYAVGAAWSAYLIEQAGDTTGNPLYLYAGAPTDNNAFIFFAGAWESIQPKIADGTFVIKNSSEAIALQDKATLTRDEQASIIGQVTTNWDFSTALNLAEANLTVAQAADKGTVYILAPNDGTARAIADAFAADKDVAQYFITGQDAEKASVQYIIDGKQSMTVFKDVRTLAADAVAAANAFVAGTTPEATNSYNNGVIDVPAKPSAIVTVTSDNVQSALIDSGYYQASDFTGLK